MDQTPFYRGLEEAQRRASDAESEPARAVQEAVDAYVATRQAGVPGESAAWACQQGCAHCCRHPVGITAVEAVELCTAILELPELRRQHVVDRIEAAAESTQGLGWSELSGIACPLLEDERCLIYDRRPVPCRAFGSVDADACREPRRHPVPKFDRAAFAYGLGAAQALAGTTGHRELRAALAAMLRASRHGLGDDEAMQRFGSARPSGDDA